MAVIIGLNLLNDQLQEDSDALIGHILLCGSLIRSNKLDSGSDDDLSKCVQLLTAATHHKLVHSSMAFTFLIELLSKVNTDGLV